MFFKSYSIKKDKLLIEETIILVENFSDHIKKSQRLGLVSGKELLEAKEILIEVTKISEENKYTFKEWNNGGSPLDSISRRKLYRLHKYLSQFNDGIKQGKDAFEKWKNQSQSKLDDNIDNSIETKKEKIDIKKAWDGANKLIEAEDEQFKKIVKEEHEKKIKEGISLLDNSAFKPKGKAIFLIKEATLPNTESNMQSSENLQKDIGWAEGVFSSGIMFRVECWAIDGITMLTYYIPGQEHERHSSDYFFKELLVKEGLIEFISDKQFIEVGKLRNKFDLPLVWCVNVTVGDEDETYIIDNTPLKPYAANVPNRLSIDGYYK